MALTIRKLNPLLFKGDKSGITLTSLILRTCCLLLFLLGTKALAQDLDIVAGQPLAIDKESIRDSTNNELKVIAPTLSELEIDPAVLNRLMQEIAREPEVVKQRLRINDDKLQDLFITLSNARSFINTNEIASIRVMCNAFNNSAVTGPARIKESLAAYERRSAFTKSFIYKYYLKTRLDIEHGLDQQALVSFNAYMHDRRRRMASAGNVTMGIPTHNVTSGTEAVNFHCAR